MTGRVFFFDSHGGMHAVCDPATPGAAAFGPESASRRASPEEGGLTVQKGETPWAAAIRAGRLMLSDGGWYLLAAPATGGAE